MKQVILFLIRFYQKTAFFHNTLFRMLFLTDQACRFTPTCSDYMYQAVEKYGAVKGLYFGIKRILRCNPWNKGGPDILK